MSQTATIHARIDSETKEKAEYILRKIGMSPTEMIRLLYRQVALREAFPLELRIPNKQTAETLDKSDRGEEIESFDTVEKMMDSWSS